MRLHALQYLRAVAALLVVFSHACIQVPEYESRLVEFGAFGVDIFFVLSGFIMFYIAKPDQKPGDFIVNRIRRVVPLYWFFTILMVVIYLVMPSVFNKAQIGVDSTLKSLFFIPHWSAAHPDRTWPIVPPGWSLNFEMYFYSLFALSMFAKPQWRLAIITAAISVGFLIAIQVDSTGPLHHFFADNTVFEFVLGMLLAYTFKRGFKLPPAAGWLLIAVGFFLLFIHSQFWGLNSPAFNLPGILINGVPATMVVAGTLYITLPVNKLWVLFGDASYALYLSHIFVLGVLRALLPPILGDGLMAALLFIVISMLASLIVSIPIHHFVDNWLLRHERLSMFKSVKHREA